MSENISVNTQPPKIEDDILELFEGELQQAALKFAAYLNANQLTPKNTGLRCWKIPYEDCHLCMIQLEPDNWKFTFFFGDYDGEYGNGFVTTVQEHVKICTCCNDGCSGGKAATIFGKEYKDICSQLAIQFKNPDSNSLEHIKTLIECSKITAPHSASWHSRDRSPKDPDAMREKNSERLAHLQPLIDSFENTLPREKPVDIDLAAMIKLNTIDLRYENGMMVMKAEGDKNGMLTSETFAAPLRIEMRAKTDGNSIRMRYRHSEVILNWECNPDEIQVDDMDNGSEYGRRFNGRIPVGEFLDIEWLIGSEITAVKVNGELRHAENDSFYIKKFMNREQPAPVRINPAFGSTVTVESLRVTEL